jgi:hypothetical protein
MIDVGKSMGFGTLYMTALAAISLDIILHFKCGEQL